MLETIKAAVDPNHIINPGALGLTSTDGAQAKQLKARNPRTGEYDYAFESASGAEIENCANALRRAQGTWAALDVKARGEKLLKLASALRNNRDAIANALEIDTGRRRIAQLEVDGAAYAIEGWVAQGPGLAPEEWSQGRSRPEIKHAPHFVPYALAGVISPWNFPLTLSMLARRAAPEIYAGQENGCILVGGLIENKFRVWFARSGRQVSLTSEQSVAETGATNGFHFTRRNNLVGIDVVGHE